MLGSSDQPSLLAGLEQNVKKFGPIFGFYFGRTPAVVLADFDLIKEAFKSDSLADRCQEYKKKLFASSLIAMQNKLDNFWQIFKLDHFRATETKCLQLPCGSDFNS